MGLAKAGWNTRWVDYNSFHEWILGCRLTHQERYSDFEYFRQHNYAAHPPPVPNIPRTILFIYREIWKRHQTTLHFSSSNWQRNLQFPEIMERNVFKLGQMAKLSNYRLLKGPSSQITVFCDFTLLSFHEQYPLIIALHHIFLIINIFQCSLVGKTSLSVKTWLPREWQRKTFSPDGAFAAIFFSLCLNIVLFFPSFFSVAGDLDQIPKFHLVR